MKKLSDRNSIATKAFRLLAILVVAITFSACDPDRPYYDEPGYPGYASEFVGNWELVSINSMPIYPDEYTTFQMWQNGSGSYGFYVGNRWYEQGMSWTVSYDQYGYTMLYVNSSQGYFSYEVTYLSPGTMILVDIDTNVQLEYQRF